LSLKPFNKANEKLTQWFLVTSSSGNNVQYLDGIRAIAVLFVLVRHSWWLGGHPDLIIKIPLFKDALNLTPVVIMMGNGVDLFFVLSGFLLAQNFIRSDFSGKPRPSLKNYFKHRFFRIAPAYYCCLFLTLLFFTPQFIQPSAIYSAQGLRVLTAHLLFMQYNYLPATGSYGINSPFWTLTIEVMFYLMLPWVTVLFMRQRWKIFFPLSIVVAFSWLFITRQGYNPLIWVVKLINGDDTNPVLINYYLSTEFPTHIVAFSAGMMLANFYVRQKLGYTTRLFERLTSSLAGKIYFFGGAALILYMMNKLGSLSIYYWFWPDYKQVSDPSVDANFYYYMERVPFGIGFTLMLAGLIWGGPWLKAVFSIWPLRLVGILGFSIYLWHSPLLYLLQSYPAIQTLPAPQKFPFLLGAVTLAVLLISIGSFLLVEKPFMIKVRHKSLPKQIDILIQAPLLEQTQTLDQVPAVDQAPSKV
jgi:peptidoglycan/LPS O-acetylase OafA/YrhL